MPGIRVGFLTSQHEITVEDALAGARAADAAGVDVWVAGQLLALSRTRGKPTLEPHTLLAAIATVTTRVRIGCMVYAAPNLPPFVLAKTAVTLDHLSGGRLEVGLGTGWLEEEFRALGGPMPSSATRRAHLERTIDAIEAISQGEPWDAGDGFLVTSDPPALQQPHPPLWIAGQEPRMLELVGRRADWSNFARGISVDGFEEAASLIRRSSLAAGRDERAVRLSLTNTFLGGLDGPAFEPRLEARASEHHTEPEAYREQLRASNAFVGTPEEIAGQMRPYVEAGCEAFVLWSLERHDPSGPAVLAAARASLDA